MRKEEEEEMGGVVVKKKKKRERSGAPVFSVREDPGERDCSIYKMAHALSSPQGPREYNLGGVSGDFVMSSGHKRGKKKKRRDPSVFIIYSRNIRR